LTECNRDKEKQVGSNAVENRPETTVIGIFQARLRGSLLSTNVVSLWLSVDKNIDVNFLLEDNNFLDQLLDGFNVVILI
jgi:hypothetical protein